MTTYLIFGASRGLGAFFSQQLPAAGDTVYLVSRSQPDTSQADGIDRIWIQADLSADGVAARVAQSLSSITLDVCLYSAGIWEELAFSSSYDFDQVSDDEIERIVTVNLVSAITGVQKLLPALRRSASGKIIFIGSNAGLENARRPEVAYAASKFGIRGLTHALREVVRKDSIAVTCLNLGDIGAINAVNGTFEVEIGASGRKLIALSDILVMVKAIIALSNASCVKELDLFAMTDDM